MAHSSALRLGQHHTGEDDRLSDEHHEKDFQRGSATSFRRAGLSRRAVAVPIAIFLPSRRSHSADGTRRSGRLVAAMAPAFKALPAPLPPPPPSAAPAGREAQNQQQHDSAIEGIDDQRHKASAQMNAKLGQ
jgi:hypothetical protein